MKKIDVETTGSKPEKSPVKRLLGKNIRLMRKSMGLSQEQLAFKLGTSPKHLGYIENGDSFVSAELLEKISICLDAPVHMLFYDYESASRQGDNKLKMQLTLSKIEAVMDCEILQAYKNIKETIEKMKNSPESCNSARD